MIVVLLCHPYTFQLSFAATDVTCIQEWLKVERLLSALEAVSEGLLNIHFGYNSSTCLMWPTFANQLNKKAEVIRGCDKDTRARQGKLNSTLGRLLNTWNSKSQHQNKELTEALVMPTLLYGAEMWHMTVANIKRLETAHHSWQRKILGIVWRQNYKHRCKKKDRYG